MLRKIGIFSANLVESDFFDFSTGWGGLFSLIFAQARSELNFQFSCQAGP